MRAAKHWPMLAAAIAALHIAVSPAVAAPGGQFHVTVTGLPAPAAAVVVHGGVASQGKMFGLVALRSQGPAAWFTILRAPGLLGVYPIRVRTGGVYHETDAVVSVLPKGFSAALHAATPEDVVQRWREAAPNGVTIARTSTWRAGFYFHRDQRYNRLLRVEFTLLGNWPRYRLAEGTSVRWFNVVRTTQTAPWRLAQIITAP
jgi:hypothetical protein